MGFLEINKNPRAGRHPPVPSDICGSRGTFTLWELNRTGKQTETNKVTREQETTSDQRQTTSTHSNSNQQKSHPYTVSRVDID